MPGPQHSPDIRFEYPLRGRDAVRAFAGKFRAAFPDLNFWGTAGLITEGDYAVGQWEGGGTHTGDAFDDMSVGSLPANLDRTFPGFSHDIHGVEAAADGTYRIMCLKEDAPANAVTNAEPLQHG
jgi:hypothetical protein